MKKTITILVFLSFICVFNNNAQIAKVLFINNNSGANAASLDFEVRVMPQDTVYSTYPGVNFTKATPQISVPANTILKFVFLKAGTSTSFYSVTNVVFNPNDFRILFLYGTGSSISYSAFTGYNQSSSGSVVKLGFRHSTPSLQKIDLVIRELNQKIADDFSFSNSTFGTTLEYNAATYTLDMTPFDNNNIGLFSYILPSSSLGGDYIYLFTSGTGSANDMYMAEMNGTVTKLATTSTITNNETLGSANNVGNISVFPNPARDIVNIKTKSLIDSPEFISIKNYCGQTILQLPFTNSIDVSAIPSGVFFAEIIEKEGISRCKFLISK